MNIIMSEGDQIEIKAFGKKKTYSIMCDNNRKITISEWKDNTWVNLN